jgi:hypothetical protein
MGRCEEGLELEVGDLGEGVQGIEITVKVDNSPRVFLSIVEVRVFGR